MEPVAVIELLDRDGQVRFSQKIHQWPCRIGRALDCDLVVDDPHMAAVHAELHWTEHGVRLQAAPSLNGVHLGARRLASGEQTTIAGTEVWTLGATAIRVRSSLDALAPEQALHAHRLPIRGWHRALTPMLLVLWAFLLWYDRWAVLNPDATWTDYSAPLLGPVAVLLVWAGFWALLTQLFQRRFPFGLHLQRSLKVITGLHVWSLLLPVLAYSLSLPRLMVLDNLAYALGLAGLLWWQAQLVWPKARRLLSSLTLALLTLGVGLTIANRQEQQHWFGPPYLSALPPPALRLATPRPPEALIEDLRGLEAELARQANKVNLDASAEAPAE